ncbi:DsrE family protein [Sandarakinorhabdus limnophila]|jgi:intracellular sulfur oxidation DsrE/DsrF family protein|uniref:DsrE family protein n=1 Tax=Sandarakinorhabdus limnophila TaxID=210512 RepID=UPI0037C66F21
MRALLIAVLLAAPAAATDGPVFKGFGTHTPVEHNVAIPKGMALRHVYDVTKAASGKLNPGFETAARFINSHVANGVSERDVAVAVVVHGPAIVELTKPEVYAARNSGTSNASEAMVKEMLAKGVRFLVCGQAANAMGVKKADLLPGVELSISASSAHAILQAQGYTLNPF